MKRFVTAVIMIVGVVAIVAGVVLAATGALHFRNTDDETGATIDKKELKEKANEATESLQQGGSEVLDKAGDALNKAAEKVRGSSDDQKTTPPPADEHTPAGDRGTQP